MNFDLYYASRGKDGKLKPGVKALPTPFEGIISVMKQPWLKERVDQYRGGDASAKLQLPAVDFVGTTKTGYRQADQCVPTQFVMIDIDHCKDPRGAWQEISAKIGDVNPLMGGKYWIGFAHITCSGQGLRIIFRASQDYPTLVGHMEWLRDELCLTKYGDFDSKVKDFSRLSFLSTWDDILYVHSGIMNGTVKPDNDPVQYANAFTSDTQGNLFADNSYKEFSEEEIAKFKDFRYRGVELNIIVDKYLEVFGTPGPGEKHSYYNEMVKNFRTICDNNKRLLLYYLPSFDHTLEERWSQIISICRVNTLSRIPKTFYFFLKDHGFLEVGGRQDSDLKQYMLDDKEAKIVMPPYLPPVFRELVGGAPVDFILPAVNSLLPILGTLTSYLGAIYPYDSRVHTTSFFSVIYAPPGTGKGFVERYLDLLFEDLRIRDYVQSERENVYLRAIQKKGANDKAPDMPHTSLRLIPPKNSEAEFLQKQRDNHGYHMFTYAAEMDSWAKGVKAAGGNKDDMIRIAWDNGEYGQQFKSANTFKGSVNLYWNVLITGTIAQVDSYFKNVENGLVTRCSFTEIKNQEFSLPPVWKQLTKRGKETIKAFLHRCDERTYETPCTIDPFSLVGVNDDDFDKEVDWHFKFKDRQMVDMDWIMPTINKFHKEQMEIAARDIDRARDVFRRRVGVRGFRLALLCMGLWEKPREMDLQKCVQFVDWWMHRDLECILELWGTKYNELTDVTPHVVQRTVFDSLKDDFNRSDVYTVCMKQGIKTPVRRIIHDWRKLGYIVAIDKEHFKKKK